MESLWTRRPPRRVDEHSGDKACQIELVFEPLVEGAEVVTSVLAKLEGPGLPLDQGLQVAEHRVHAAEIRHLSGLALANDNVGLGAAYFVYGREARVSIAQHVRARLQACQGPVLDRLLCKAANRRKRLVQRVAVGVQRHASQEGHLVRRATADEAKPIAAEIGIAGLNCVIEPVLLIGAGHHAADFLLNQPSRLLADIEVAHVRQRGQPGLGLAHGVEGKKPDAQRKIRTVHHGVGGERRLGGLCRYARVDALGTSVSRDLSSRGRARHALVGIKPAEELCIPHLCILPVVEYMIHI